MVWNSFQACFHLDGFHVSKALFVFFFKKLLPSWQKAWKSFKVKTLVHSSPLMSDNIDPSNHCLVFLWERLFQDVDSFHQTSKWSPLRLSTHIQHTSSFDLGVHILEFRNFFIHFQSWKWKENCLKNIWKCKVDLFQFIYLRFPPKLMRGMISL